MINAAELQAATVLWDILAELGYVDARGSAEYRKAFALDDHVYTFSQAAYRIVGRLMMPDAGRNEVASEANRP